jgi:DNA-binding response OmpR family regulator
VEILLLSGADKHEPARALPCLDLLAHTVVTAPLDALAVVSESAPDVVLVDSRPHLAEARSSCRMVRAAGSRVPLLAVVAESSLVAVSADWGVDDVILTSAGPAEVEARLRLAVGRRDVADFAVSSTIRGGELTIDPVTYAAKLNGRTLDLTYKEFELLRFLAQHPGRVFTRAQLLREVWGYDYFGGTRTVDVHVRRLRAKMGPQYESMLGTVRQVGYKFVVPAARTLPEISAIAV